MEKSIPRALTSIPTLPPELIASLRDVDLLGESRSLGLEEELIGMTCEYVRMALALPEARRYWGYTLACAHLCGIIFPTAARSATLGYAAGLFHDLGRLGLMVAYPQKYSNLLALAEREFARGSPFDFSAYERTLFGLDRYDTGVLLGEIWGLPPWIRQVVARYQIEDRSGICSLVRGSCGLASVFGYGFINQARPVDAVIAEMPEAVWLHYRNDPFELKSALEERMVRIAE